MATKKTNKKTKQNTSKKTSSNRQKNVDRADAIRVTEIATVAVSVILFCLAIVSGNGVWNMPTYTLLHSSFSIFHNPLSHHVRYRPRGGHFSL